MKTSFCNHHAYENPEERGVGGGSWAWYLGKKENVFELLIIILYNEEKENENTE